MSILDNGLIDRAVASGASTLAAGSWVGSLAAKGKTQVVPGLPLALQGAAGQSLDRIASGKGALGAIASGDFLKITSYLSLGMEDQARLTYLRSRASHDERQSALKAAMGAAYDADKARAAAWAEVRVIALDVLKLMGQAAIPLLLAAL